MSKLRTMSPKQAGNRPGPLDTSLDTGIFKALSDPTRRRIFACIAKSGRGCSVSEVAECCAVDFSVVSRHLAVLARDGLLKSEKSGRVMRYIVRYQDVATALQRLSTAIMGCGCATGCCANPNEGTQRER